MVFYICHIYLGHSSAFISLQLLHQQNCSKWAISAKTWRAVTERERGLTWATSMFGECLKATPPNWIKLRLANHNLKNHSKNQSPVSGPICRLVTGRVVWLVLIRPGNTFLAQVIGSTSEGKYNTVNYYIRESDLLKMSEFGDYPIFI